MASPRYGPGHRLRGDGTSMSLLDHLKSSRTAVAAPEQPVAPPAQPQNAPIPFASTASVEPPPVRVSRITPRTEALVELKSRVHEELIHELDPEQLLGDVSFAS